jgi:hypothetical protein
MSSALSAKVKLASHLCNVMSLLAVEMIANFVTTIFNLMKVDLICVGFDSPEPIFKKALQIIIVSLQALPGHEELRTKVSIGLFIQVLRC